MSDTPRTDALAHECLDGDLNGVMVVSVLFARQLERELAEVANQRDLLIEGLEKLASCDWVITLPDRMDAVREIAKQTLQIVKNNKY